ncbi:MAG: hypothetical protein AAGF14_03650 [Pseudomonadota bacterium]
MRWLMPILLVCFCMAAAPDARAEDKGATPKPPESMIIAMAQQFVLEHFERDPADFFDVSFDIVNIHPQPDPNYWAVIGGFMADSGGKNYKPHAYGVAMRLVCADAEKIECWQLEKLVIDQKIILNN